MGFVLFHRMHRRQTVQTLNLVKITQTGSNEHEPHASLVYPQIHSLGIPINFCEIM